MVSGKHKSKTYRKVRVKTPGGRVTIHYRKRKPGKAKCGNCGKPLAGTIRERPYKIQNTPKTKKRPERPYGGVLCSKCTRELIKSKARK